MDIFLSVKIKKLFILMLPIFLCLAFTEVLGLAILIPLFSIIFQFDLISSKFEFLGNSFVQNAIIYLNSNSEFLFFLILIYFLLRFVIIFFSQKKLTNFKSKVFFLISNDLLKNYLNLKYIDFIKLNSSVLRRQVAEVHNYSEYLFNILTIFSETIIFIFIIIFLLFFDFYNVSIALIFIMIGLIPILLLFKKFQKKLSSERVDSANNYFKILDQSLGNFIYLKISNKIDSFLENFKFYTKIYSQNSAKSQLISVLPKPLLETIFILILTLFLSSVHGLSKSEMNIFILSSLVYGFSIYRLAPSLIKIFSSFSSISYLKNSRKILHKDLTMYEEKLNEDLINFKNTLELSNISFEYDDKKILENFSFKFKKGKKYLISGESGKGKSTLLLILMGLLRPQLGKIIIDDNKYEIWNSLQWRKKISYIPQKTYLLDSDLKSNIVFKGKVDQEKVNEIISSLNLKNLLNLFERDNKKTIGDGANQISGGQAQRISIARALYKDADILVMDEPTANLDKDNEKKIMDLIFLTLFKNKTIIFTSHNSNNFNYADEVIEL